jgi:hypothetical protein
MTKIHIALTGDTFESIAKKYHVSVDALRRYNANNKQGDGIMFLTFAERFYMVRPGDRVMIPPNVHLVRTFQGNSTTQSQKNAAGKAYAVVRAEGQTSSLRDVVRDIDEFTFSAAEQIGHISKVVEQSAGKTRLGVNMGRLKDLNFSDGLNIYYPTKKGGIFFGNGSVQTYSISHMAGTIEKWTGAAGKVDTGANIFVKAAEEGTLGRETQQKVVGAVGNEVGQKAGAASAAAICTYFGVATDGLGFAVCGVVGAIIGGEVGEAMGEAGTKQVQEAAEEMQRKTYHGVRDQLGADPFNTNPFNDPFNYN